MTIPENMRLVFRINRMRCQYFSPLPGQISRCTAKKVVTRVYRRPPPSSARGFLVLDSFLVATVDSTSLKRICLVTPAQIDSVNTLEYSSIVTSEDGKETSWVGNLGYGQQRPRQSKVRCRTFWSYT